MRILGILDIIANRGTCTLYTCTPVHLYTTLYMYMYTCTPHYTCTCIHDHMCNVYVQEGIHVHVHVHVYVHGIYTCT